MKSPRRSEAPSADAAKFQIRRVAAERKVPEGDIEKLVLQHTASRQWGFLGESRVNVLELNLALDERFPMAADN